MNEQIYIFTSIVIPVVIFIFMFLWCKNDLKKDKEKIKMLDNQIEDSLKRISKLLINNSKRG